MRMLSASAVLSKTAEVARMAEKKKENEETALSQSILDNILAEDVTSGYDGAAELETYRRIYEEQGRKAAENVFGLASASTGGYGNSYGATAARAVLGDYSDKLADKAQELEQKAYERGKDNREELYRRYETVKKAEEDERETALSFAESAAQLGDYSYLEKLGIDTSGEAKKQALSFAVTAAQNGDYSYLNALGVDTSLTEAETLARYGDYSGLAEMGIDVSKLSRDDLVSLAQIYASYGDYSLLRLLGVNTSGQESDDAAARRLMAARIYSLYR